MSVPQKGVKNTNALPISFGVLRTRYARGEITDEQFEQKVEKLLETESLDEPTDREKAQDVLTERDD